MKITAMLKTRQSSLWSSHLYGAVISMEKSSVCIEKSVGQRQLFWVVCLETGRNNQEVGTCRIMGLSLYVCGD